MTAGDDAVSTIVHKEVVDIAAGHHKQNDQLLDSEDHRAQSPTSSGENAEPVFDWSAAARISIVEDKIEHRLLVKLLDMRDRIALQN